MCKRFCILFIKYIYLFIIHKICFSERFSLPDLMMLHISIGHWMSCLEKIRAKSRVALRTRYRWYWELGQASLLLTYIILKYERSLPRVDYLNWAGVRMVLRPLHYTVHSTVHSVPCSGLGYTHGLLSSGQSKLRPRTVFIVNSALRQWHNFDLDNFLRTSGCYYYSIFSPISYFLFKLNLFSID